MPAPSTKKPAVKKPVAKKRVAPGQTTLAQLLKAADAQAVAINSVLAALTEMRKTPPSIVVQSGIEPPEQSGANARLNALLSIISGKGAQQLLEDMLSAGRPPSQEKLLMLADDHIARTGMKAAA